jgi:hypothetical protein
MIEDPGMSLRNCVAQSTTCFSAVIAETAVANDKLPYRVHGRPSAPDAHALRASSSRRSVVGGTANTLASHPRYRTRVEYWAALSEWDESLPRKREGGDQPPPSIAHAYFVFHQSRAIVGNGHTEYKAGERNLPAFGVSTFVAV